MAGVLQELLHAEEPLFSLAVRQLEVASGQAARDVQLIADIAEKVRGAMKALGLDPCDTTGPELYAALMARVKADTAQLATRLGGGDPDDVSDMVPRIVAAVKKLDIPKECWVLKRSAAKKLLKAMPPRKLMKQLGHRSVDSMLKHENIDELYVAVRFSEGDEWLKAFNKQFITLSAQDFETRNSTVLVLESDTYADLAEQFLFGKKHLVAHSKEMGVVAVMMPKTQHIKGLTLTTWCLLVRYINELRQYSAFFKLRQVQPNFGAIVADALSEDLHNTAEIAGQRVHWRVVQCYYADSAENYPELFQPHVQPEDLSWHTAEASLCRLDSTLNFWLGNGYCGKQCGSVLLSFNLLDAAMNYAAGASYAMTSAQHMRDSLWNELYIRYMGASTLRNQVLAQLDDAIIAPDDLTA